MGQAGQEDNHAAALDGEVIRHAREIAAAAREEIGRADIKASLVFSASGVVVGALLAASLSGNWSPFDLDNRVEWLWWIGVAAAGSSLIFLGIAVYPKTRRQGKQNGPLIAYYEDVVLTGSAGLEEALEKTVANPRSAPLDQLLQLSLIVHSKYRSIRIGLLALVSAVAICTLSLVINLML